MLPPSHHGIMLERLSTLKMVVLNHIFDYVKENTQNAFFLTEHMSVLFVGRSILRFFLTQLDLFPFLYFNAKSAKNLMQ